MTKFVTLYWFVLILVKRKKTQFYLLKHLQFLLIESKLLDDKALSFSIENRQTDDLIVAQIFLGLK